jgi:hypothetical protein
MNNEAPKEQVVRKQTAKYDFPDDVKERARVLLKEFLKEQGVGVPELAERLSERYSRPESRTNLLNKFARASFKLVDIIEIAALYDCEVKIVPKK